MVAAVLPETGTHREYQTTIHLQTRVVAQSAYEAREQARQSFDAMFAEKELPMDAFSIPLTRDMLAEAESAPKNRSTVIVAFEVQSPSEGTASCVSHEVAGYVQEETNKGLEQIADAENRISNYSATVNDYEVAAARYEEQGLTQRAAESRQTAEVYRNHLSTAQAALEKVSTEHSDTYSQGRIASFEVVQIIPGRQPEDVIVRA